MVPSFLEARTKRETRKFGLFSWPGKRRLLNSFKEINFFSYIKFYWEFSNLCHLMEPLIYVAGGQPSLQSG